MTHLYCSIFVSFNVSGLLNTLMFDRRLNSSSSRRLDFDFNDGQSYVKGNIPYLPLLEHVFSFVMRSCMLSNY